MDYPKLISEKWNLTAKFNCLDGHALLDVPFALRVPMCDKMGVSLVSWRQRIGLYHPPKAKASRVLLLWDSEVLFPSSSSSWRFGIGGSTFLIILMTVMIGRCFIFITIQKCFTKKHIGLGPVH